MEIFILALVIVGAVATVDIPESSNSIKLKHDKSI